MSPLLKRRLVKIAFNVLAAAVAALGAAFGINSCIKP